MDMTDIIRMATEAAKDDWRVAAGLAAAGVLIGVGKWAYNRHKKRKAK